MQIKKAADTKIVISAQEDSEAGSERERKRGGSRRRTHKRQYKTSVQLKNYTNKKQMGRKKEQKR